MNNNSSPQKELLHKWTFTWDSLSVMIEGHSPIDLPQLEIKNATDADLFIRGYGFNPDDSNDRRHIRAVIVEALEFMEHYLMPVEWAAGKIPPKEIYDATDVRDLLLWAADRSEDNELRQAWACSLLRVMHGIAHIDQARDASIDVAREQIVARLDKYIYHDASDTLMFGTPANHVDVARVDWKLYKTRQSILLKLMHKKGNVSEEINDQLGIRIITKRLCDVVRVVQIMRDYHMINFVNCTPARSRNSLINLDNFRYNMEKLQQMLGSAKIDGNEFDILMEHLTAPTRKTLKSANALNPHTGSNYRSIQFTCRQMIDIQNPYRAWHQKMLEMINDKYMDSETRQALKYTEGLYQDWMENNGKSCRQFFPFEVHILDEESFEKNKHGSASHIRYKQSQIRAVRRRVLHHLLQLLAKKR